MGVKSDLEALLLAAQTGKGAYLIDEASLYALYNHAATKNLILDGVEVFRLADGLEHPHVELTLTPTDTHRIHAGLNWPDRIKAMNTDLDVMIAETRKIGGEFRFTAWVSNETDWI